MKLIDIKPFVYENLSDDDIFNEPELPTSGPDLIAVLQRKEKATNWQSYRLRKDVNHIANRVKRAYEFVNYPGGQNQWYADLKSKKTIEVAGDIAIPNTPENQLIKQKIDKMIEQANQASKVGKELHSQINRLKKAEAAKSLEAKISGSTISDQIPESQVPDRIYVTARKNFGNPYFAGEKNRYAGDPTFFSWTPQMLMMYQELEKILTSSGLEGFTVMYASTLVYDDWRQKSNHYNFAVIGANGRFIWRKYDISPGSGQNWIYVNGAQHYASRFFSLQQSNPLAFAKLIATMKQP